MTYRYLITTSLQTQAPVNLTEARHFHEMETLVATDERYGTSKGTMVAEAARCVEATKPLYELLQPTFAKLASGLAGMTMIVGSSTVPKDITPDGLAVALLLKKRCDTDVILPLLELREVVDARRNELEASLKNQVAQLEALKANVSMLKQSMALLTEKALVAQSNATSLSHRSSSVLQSSKDLLPTLTRAEFSYFKELEQLEEKTRLWAEDFVEMKIGLEKVCDWVESGPPVSTELSVEIAQNCNAVLLGNETHTKEQTSKLKQVKDRLDELAFEVGFDTEQEREFSLRQ